MAKGVPIATSQKEIKRCSRMAYLNRDSAGGVRDVITINYLNYKLSPRGEIDSEGGACQRALICPVLGLELWVKIKFTHASNTKVKNSAHLGGEDRYCVRSLDDIEMH
jgi:hypothetical protein